MSMLDLGDGYQARHIPKRRCQRNFNIIRNFRQEYILLFAGNNSTVQTLFNKMK